MVQAVGIWILKNQALTSQAISSLISELNNILNRRNFKIKLPLLLIALFLWMNNHGFERKYNLCEKYKDLRLLKKFEMKESPAKYPELRKVRQYEKSTKSSAYGMSIHSYSDQFGKSEAVIYGLKNLSLVAMF